MTAIDRVGQHRSTGSVELEDHQSDARHERVHSAFQSYRDIIRMALQRIDQMTEQISGECASLCPQKRDC